MRFVLCCIVSLGLLYAVILRDEGYLVDPARVTRQVTKRVTQQVARDAWAAPQQAGEAIAAVAGPQITARLEAFCRHDPSGCLAAAALAPRRAGRVPLGAVTP